MSVEAAASQYPYVTDPKPVILASVLGKFYLLLILLHLIPSSMQLLLPHGKILHKPISFPSTKVMRLYDKVLKRMTFSVSLIVVFCVIFLFNVVYIYVQPIICRTSSVGQEPPQNRYPLVKNSPCILWLWDLI